MDNKWFLKCKNCGDTYCGQCSYYDHWEDFCSDECYKEYLESARKEDVTK